MEGNSNGRGARIRLVVDRVDYAQGESIGGEVHVTSGGEEQVLESLRLELTEYREGGEGGSLDVRQTEMLEDGPLTVTAGLERGYKLALQLPQNCRLSRRDEGWRVAAIGDRRLAFNVRAEIPLEVIPASEMLAIVDACVSRLKFAETGRESWSPRHTSITMVPTGPDATEIDFLEFRLRQDGTGGVEGSLLVRFSRASLVESLRALFGSRDRSRFQPRLALTLSADELFHADGDVNEDAISQYIRSLVDNATRARRDP